MSMGKIAVLVLAVAIGGLGIGAALADSPDSVPGSPIELVDDVRKSEVDDEVLLAEEQEGDGDDTKGDDGTGGGNNTGDGDNTRGNDGTNGGDNTGDGDNTRGNDGTNGGDNTGDGDNTAGNDGTNGGDNTDWGGGGGGGSDSGGGGGDT